MQLWEIDKVFQNLSTGDDFLATREVVVPLTNVWEMDTVIHTS